MSSLQVDGASDEIGEQERCVGPEALQAGEEVSPLRARIDDVDRREEDEGEDEEVEEDHLFRGRAEQRVVKNAGDEDRNESVLPEERIAVDGANVDENVNCREHKPVEWRENR